jgi:protein gp37
MQPSDIAWTDYTWNPTHGCSKVSPGCENCYAERISRQYGHTDEPWTSEHAAENVSEHPEKLEEPLSLDQPARVFVNSMSDLFHEQVSVAFIQAVFGIMRNCPHVVFQVLTKRPWRAAELPIQWPPNVWLGTSVEDESVTRRIDQLYQTDAALRFISFEPLIGSVGSLNLDGIDWAIVGGESGPDDQRREMDHEWARDILRQCREQEVAFFFKQSSGRYPETEPFLSVERGGLMVQEQIREVPEPHEAVRDARAALRSEGGGST